MSRSTQLIIAISAVITLAGCKKKGGDAPQAGSGSAETGSGATAGGSGSDTATAGSGSGSGSAAEAPDPRKLGVFTEGLSTPESVLYDADADIYLISNINGGPSDVDDNGFISRVKPDGTVETLKWIDGAADDVKLDAPKGMAISGGTLWVADITAVRTFDAKTGKPTGDVPIDGATFLNDVASDGKGGIFVSDSGLDVKFQPTGTDAIHHVGKDRKATALIKSKDLGAPNGVWPAADGALWVVTFGTGELYQVNAKGEKQAGEKLPKGQLDGVIELEGGDLLISSWEGAAVFRGKPGGEWKEVVTGVKAPADIGWDSKRGAVLIPLFQDNLAVFPVVK